MLQQISKGVINEADLELKVVPSDKSYTIQIHSSTIRGTIIVDPDVDREELQQLGGLIGEMLDEFEIPIPEGEHVL